MRVQQRADRTGQGRPKGRPEGVALIRARKSALRCLAEPVERLLHVLVGCEAPRCLSMNSILTILRFSSAPVRDIVHGQVIHPR
jgi:hypothetical protein